MRQCKNKREVDDGYMYCVRRNDHPGAHQDAGGVCWATQPDWRAIAEELAAALGPALWLAEKWADGVGESHPDHEIVDDARAALKRFGAAKGKVGG